MSIHQADPAGAWSVEDVGAGTYLFRWHKGFYVSPFCLTGEGVIAFDPIDEVAAAGYRDAVASVTGAPFRAVVYSHDHRDHIGGAAVLAPEAEVVAHGSTVTRLRERGDASVRAPTRAFADDEDLRFGRTVIRCRYFGPNHSQTNSAFVLPAGAGPMLVFVDVIEAETTPYRNLPDTDLSGLITSLRSAEQEDFSQVLGGHVGPAGREWAELTRRYLEDLVQATDVEWRAGGGQTPDEGEDGIAMTERVRRQTCERAAERLRTEYGTWSGFDAWAPMNADRVLSYLITGN